MSRPYTDIKDILYDEFGIQTASGTLELEDGPTRWALHEFLVVAHDIEQNRVPYATLDDKLGLLADVPVCDVSSERRAENVQRLRDGLRHIAALADAAEELGVDKTGICEMVKPLTIALVGRWGQEIATVRELDAALIHASQEISSLEAKAAPILVTVAERGVEGGHAAHVASEEKCRNIG